jgi:hypothetical protein
MKKPPFTLLCSDCHRAVVYHVAASFTCPTCASTQCTVVEGKDDAVLLTAVSHHGVSGEHIFPRELIQRTVLTPPNVAEFLLTMLATTRHAEATIGDLSERFTIDCKRLGATAPSASIGRARCARCGPW